MEDWFNRYGLKRDYIKEPLKGVKDLPLDEDLALLFSQTIPTKDIAMYFKRSLSFARKHRRRLGLIVTPEKAREVLRLVVGRTSPETRETAVLKMKAYWTPENSEKMSQRKKEYYKANPDKAEKLSTLLKDYRADPRKIEKANRKRQEYWARSENREKTGQKVKEYYKDPKNREKVSQRQREYYKNNPDKAKELGRKRSAFYKNSPLAGEKKEQIAQRVYEAKLKNNTFYGKEILVNEGTTYRCSASEKHFYNNLMMNYKDIEFQKRIKGYGTCDFYIPDLDLYIELQAAWIHGPKPYHPDDPICIVQLEEWKSQPQIRINSRGGESPNFYAVAIEQWTKRDVKRRAFMTEKGHNFLEYFPNEEFVITDYKTEQGKVKYYQQDIFFAKEREALMDPIVRWQVFENAKKYSRFYAEHGYLDNRTILERFRVARLWHDAYSSFNISLCKRIPKDCVVYDPCGGWGHRLLGFKNHKGYIYNDISFSIMENCKIMAWDSGITNAVFYNEDASGLKPKEEYDTVFTCPPYWNKEIFSEEGAENLSLEDFKVWWSKVFENLHPKTGEVYLVIPSDLIGVFCVRSYEVIWSESTRSHYHTDAESKSSQIMVLMKR